MNRPTMLSAILAVSLFLPGCAAVLGTDEGEQHGTPGRQPIRIDYVETLRSQQSLGSARYAEAESSVPGIRRPSAVAADPFRVYVAEQSPGGRLAIFERGERILRFVTGPTPSAPAGFSQFGELSGIAVDNAGVIFLSDAQRGRVVGLDRNGVLLLSIGQRGEFSTPSALAVDRTRNRLYVADKHDGVVRVFSFRGDPLMEMGGRGTKGGFTAPVGIALDRSGVCYVLDAVKHRVSLYDQNGVFLRTIVLQAAPGHTITRPSGIAVDSTGRIFVSDADKSAIWIYGPDGELIQSFGGMGSRRDEFWGPAGLFIDSGDVLYVADQMNDRIQVYQIEK